MPQTLADRCHAGREVGGHVGQLERLVIGGGGGDVTNEWFERERSVAIIW